MTASVMPLPAEMRRSVLSSPQTQQQRRRVAAATKAAAARWAADFEAEAHVGDDKSVPPEESPLSWWTASVSEVQALERLISARVNKASQLALDRPAGCSDTVAVAVSRLDDGSDALVALRNAGTPVEPACRASDIAALQEDFVRLAAQVRIQEGRFGPWSSALESDMAELRKLIENLREQMEGRVQKSLTVSELLTDQASHSASAQAEVRREIDDLRDRCSTLTGIVEDLARGQSRLADRLSPTPRQSPDVDFATIFGPEAQQVVAKLAEETAIAISRQIAEETRTISVDCAKDAACRVAEETASSIVNVASAVQAEVAQLRQTQAEMLKELATFRAKQDSSSRDGNVVKEMDASFADAWRRLEASCKAAHDAISQHREEHRATHEDLTGKIATSEMTLAALKSRFEAFFSQERFLSPKNNMGLADKTDSPGQPLSSQELVELRLDLDTAFCEIRQMREEQASLLVIDTPRGRVALTSLPGELEELKLQLDRVVRELREEKDNVTQRALEAVENSRIEQLLPASLQSFREDIEYAICEIRAEVSKVETSCIESILPSSLQMFRDEIEKVVGELRESISNTTERIQSQNLQLPQADPGLASDIDKIKLELQAFRDAQDIDMLRSELQASCTRDIDAVKAELRTLQEDRAVQQNALDEGVVCIAKVVGDLRKELSDALDVSHSVEQLHGVLEKSVAKFDSALPTLSERKSVADLNADFDHAQAEKLSHMANTLGDSCARNLQAAVDTFRRASVDDELRLNLCRLIGVVDELLRHPARGGAAESQGDSAQVTMSLDQLRVQCQELARSIQVPSDLQLQVSELSTRVDEIVEGGTEVCETQKIALSHLESSRTALQSMIELLNNSNAAATVAAEIDEQRSSPSRPAQVPALAMECVAPKLDQFVETASSTLQLPTNQAGVEELWVALGGRSLAEQVQDLRQGQVSPRRWEELRDQHAELSRMVAMMQDMHCHHVRALWEDLRAVCRELASISETSEATAAQAAAAQAMGVGAAASQAVTLWEELGTPRRAELVGMIGEVRSLRNEVERLRSVKEDDAVVAADEISNVVEDVPLQNIMGEEAFLNLRPSHSSRRASWRRPSQENADAREEIITLTSQATSESSEARGRRLSPKGLGGTEEAASDLQCWGRTVVAEGRAWPSSAR